LKLGFSFGEELASDEVAVQVATIYKQFLHQFDTVYVTAFIQESHKRNAMNSQQGQPHSQNPTIPPQPQQVPEQPPREKYRLKPTKRINKSHFVRATFSISDRSGWYLLYLVIAAILGLVFFSLSTPCKM
jgi:hypothetical protein